MTRIAQTEEPTTDIEVQTPAGDATWQVEASSAIENALAAGFQVAVDSNGFYVRNWASHEEDFPSIEEAAQAFLESLAY